MKAETGSHDGGGRPDASASPSSSPSSTTRPTVANELRDKEVSVLVKVLQTSEDYLRGHFKETLPEALNKIKDGSEEEIAGIMATMFGTINDKQMDELLKSVEEEMQKDGSSDDPRYMNLLKRLKWAKEVLKPTLGPEGVPLCCSDPSFAKFKEAMEKAWKKTKDHNNEFYTKLDQALAGSESAKDFLRTKYDHNAIIAFIDAQRQSGNLKLANDLTRALAFEDGPSKYLDTLGQGGSKDRIELPTEHEKFAETVSDFSKKSNTPVQKISFSPRKFDKPDRIFRGGAFLPKFPVATPRPPAVTPTPTAIPRVEPPPTDTPAKRAELAAGVMKGRCVACHAPGASNADDFEINADGTLKSDDQLSDVIRRAVKGEGGFMPPRSRGGEIPAADKEKIRAWAKDKNIDAN